MYHSFDRFLMACMPRTQKHAMTGAIKCLVLAVPAHMIANGVAIVIRNV